MDTQSKVSSESAGPNTLLSLSSSSASSSGEMQAHEKLLQQINSPEFTLYDCIRLIHKHSDNIGIHHYLCQKLLNFPHNELQFYIPQLVQILLTVETESMALEELLTTLRNENPHFALLTFWQLQALLADLSTDPESYGFQVARRVLNNQQQNLFNLHSKDENLSTSKEKMNENVAPALVYSAMIMSAMGLPQVANIAQPLVKSQGRKQRAYVFKLAKHAMKDLRRNVTLKNTLMNKKTKRSISSDIISISTPPSRMDIVDPTTTKEDVLFRKPKRPETDLNFDIVDNVGEQVFQDRISNYIKLPKRRSVYSDKSNVHRTYSEASLADSKKTEYGNQHAEENNAEDHEQASIGSNNNPSTDKYTNSMPDLHEMKRTHSTTNKKGESQITSTKSVSQKRNFSPGIVDISQLSTPRKIKMLKANYFRHETQFAIALETISQRLAQVPTEARLSALRAELSLLNRDLPAEVDIPTLLPTNKKGKLHKLVVITASEAQVLNSAEKVPYLLLIEYLRDEFDFDPSSNENEAILKKRPNLSSFNPDFNSYRKESSPIYDRIGQQKTDGVCENLTVETKRVTSQMSEMSMEESIYSDYSPTVNKEVDLGDISMVRVKNQSDAEAYRESLVLQSTSEIPVLPSNIEKRDPQLKFVMNLDQVIDQRKYTQADHNGGNDELADQMRISALMLAQLDKSPQELSDAANQIRAKIIASMKEGQDKFGYRDLEAIHGMAGERKLENDLKTGGIDTSYLGEDWAAKKERIRKTSEYGHLENWDLCSVIAKSGDDLRQEAFACQLIQAMAHIWAKEKVEVWVKKMKILITSANTGLVETITNAVSVHSIKKSLTKKMIDDGDLDEKGGIASLQDHFIRAFGDVNSFKYRRAQDNFACSLAAYSIICYLLQIKDRHNGNIMIDNEGHVVHIDFGFMLSNSPGSMNFEAAPFKLTYEYAEALGGTQGEPYKKFVRLTKEAFKSLQKHADQIVSMCEIMQKDNMQPCFNAGDQTSVQLKQRFHLELSEDECDDFVEHFLIAKSLGSIYTRLYDQFQLITQGIYS